MFYRLLWLVVPLLLRQYQTTRAIGKRGAKGEIIEGLPSVITWLITYLVLLGLVVRQLADQSLTWRFWIGYIVFWLAVILRWRAFRALKGFYTEAVVIQRDHRVVSDGIYRYLRHPLHLGLWFEMLGLAIISVSWLSLLPLALALAALLLRNRNEEYLLEKHLGDEYRRYRQTAWDITDLISYL
mgnify:CR=1 FL=1